jgi:hypothetical protein
MDVKNEQKIMICQMSHHATHVMIGFLPVKIAAYVAFFGKCCTLPNNDDIKNIAQPGYNIRQHNLSKNILSQPISMPHTCNMPHTCTMPHAWLQYAMLHTWVLRPTIRSFHWSFMTPK